jgi:mannose-6-phosphate isomerase
LPNCGELWALSGIPGDESVVVNGFLQDNDLNELVEIYMDELLGEQVYERYGEVFPVLLKFIDTKDYLSIQVHPDDELAAKRHDEAFGKTEMWVVLSAGPNAELISGFNKTVTREEYVKCLQEKRIKEILNVESVEAGDVFFIPAGRVHAIGPDIMLAEIQQTSDTTYRIYDWDRLDVNGLPRELHTELALDALDLTKVEEAKTKISAAENHPSVLAQCPHFTTRYLSLHGKLEPDYGLIDSFVALLCCKGEFTVEHELEITTAKAGETILIPASVCEIILESAAGAEVLEIFI